MHPLAIWPAILVTGIALAAAQLCARWIPLPKLDQSRLQTLDGLRGFMAFFVFIHHSAVWYFYLRTGKWEVPPSNLYTHFGQSAVAIFFMVTGFLFYAKVLDARHKNIDWIRLYVSRVLRLTPLYLFAMLLLLIVGAYVSDFTLREPLTRFLVNCFRWVTFNMLGTPDVNAIDNTWRMIAGVTWSLRYEWLFYFSLPLIAAMHRVKAPLPLVVVGALILPAAIAVGFKAIHFLAFAGGIGAVYMSRSNTIRLALQGTTPAIVGAACLILTIGFFRTAEHPLALLLLSVFFSIVACGNAFWGIFTSTAARILGEISYSIYLLHGILLFSVFELVIGRQTAATFSPAVHWGVVAACTPVLILFATATFAGVEAPPIARTVPFSAIIRTRFIKKKA